MTKLSLPALFAAVVLLAAACGGSGGSSASSTSTSTTTAFRVGLSTDTAGLNDRSFNHLAYVGLLRAQAKLGIDSRVIEASSSSEYIPNLTKLAQQGYDLVVAVGYTEINAVKAVAKQFPKTKFAVVDVSNADEGGLPNVEGLLFREQEAGYLAGYAAGIAAKARGGHVVSSVGGEKQPPVDRYIAGFQAGARAAFPGVQTPNAYAQDFYNPAKCKEVALRQIAAGSVVLFQVAAGCGLGVLDAAREKGVWSVGVDADQGYLGTWVLTSALKRVDVAVFEAIKDAKAGTFKGGRDAVYGIKDDGVGIGRFSPRAPKGIAAKVAAVRARMVAGEISDIPTVLK
jgi:basic membrane protein A and related proteins